MIVFGIITARGGIIQIGHAYEIGGIVKSILPQILVPGATYERANRITSGRKRLGRYG